MLHHKVILACMLLNIFNIARAGDNYNYARYVDPDVPITTGGTNTTVTVNITVIATPSHGTSIQLSTLPCPVSANLSTMASPSQPSIPFPTAANITGGIIGNMTAITRPLAPMNPGGNLFDSRPGITFHFRPSTVRPSTASHKAFNGIALAVLIAMVGAATLML